MSGRPERRVFFASLAGCKGQKPRQGSAKPEPYSPKSALSSIVHGDVGWRDCREVLSRRGDVSRVIGSKMHDLIKGPEGYFFGKSGLLRQRSGSRGIRRSTAGS